MILLYPLILVAAGYIMRRERSSPRLRGWFGFAIWVVAGSLWFFSLLTGFSIGLFLLPAVIGAVIFSAAWAPRVREAIGFFAGVGVICLVVAYIQRNGDAFDPKPWLLIGLLLCALALVAFSMSRSAERELPSV